MDCRFLAERLRTAMFLSLFCIRVEKPAHEVTFREQQGWRVVFRSRELEIP